MKQEQILSISGPNIYTTGGRCIAIGNADHKVGEWVWVDSGCIFGHSVPANAPYIPTTEEVYIEVYSTGDHKYTFRLTTIKPSGRQVIKDALCALPITPTNYYGYMLYYFENGHFVCDSQGFAFFEHIADGMNVHLYKNGVWSQELFDARNAITAEFVDGDLYWSGTGMLNYTVTSYKNLTSIKSVNYEEQVKSLFSEFKSYAQGVINRYLSPFGSQYTVTDANIITGWSAYYEGDDIHTVFNIFVSNFIWKGANAHPFTGIFSRDYLGYVKYQNSDYISYDNVIYLNGDYTYNDTSRVFGVDSKYKILSSTQQTFYTLVDIVNNATYNWTPFKGLLVNLYNKIIIITEINADTLYVYVSGADFIFSKSENTLTAINQSGFTLGNQQLTRIPRRAANKLINAIKEEFGL